MAFSYRKTRLISRYYEGLAQEYTYTVLAQGRLVSPEEFGNIVVRETPDGATVRVRDVARIELGAQDYSVAGRFNGKPGAIIAAYQLPGSNAVDAAAGVKKIMAQMKERFPEEGLRALFEDAGFTCTEAENGADALKRAEHLTPSLIVLDLSMPVMNGFEAAPLLKKKLPQTPIIMFTMFSNQALVNLALTVGVSAVFSKDQSAQVLSRAKSC